MRWLRGLYLRIMSDKRAIEWAIERAAYYTQIYRRSDGVVLRTCFKNQYIFVLMMEENCVSKSAWAASASAWAASAWAASAWGASLRLA